MKLEEIESRINDLTARMADTASLSKGTYDELDGELLVYKTAFDLLKKGTPYLARIDCIERCARHLFDGRFGLALMYYQMSPKTFKDGFDRRGGDVSKEFIVSVCRTCRHIEAKEEE
jgi:hypothetical protein